MADLILCLGDQLTPSLPMLAEAGPDDTILLVEVVEEATYVPHHPKKIAFLFAAMRHFAAELRALGKRVRYVQLEDAGNTGSFVGEVRRAVADLAPARVRLTEPGEWRVLENFKVLQATLGVPVEMLPDTRFFATHADFAAFAHGRKELRMEHFYRQLRLRTGLLMVGGKPAGGKWNFDAENRGAYDGAVPIPELPEVVPDAVTADVLALVERRFGHHFGRLHPFRFATTRSEAEALWRRFAQERLPHFGRYQDALVAGEAFLFHGVISMYLNCGLLEPRRVCAEAAAAYAAGHIPLAAAEGFIRQILGWREYVRGIYWHHMPDYATRNALGATRPLPPWFWSGNTRMRCMAEAIGHTRDEAYAHHIERLMVIGNFALMAGLNVEEVCRWYLLVYADAYEWVEMPNVLGMALFADGGPAGGGMASKPYAASGAYIHKMGDHCGRCHYDVAQKEGERACPYNRLYWGFLAQHEEVLGRNMRLVYPYATLRKFSASKRASVEREYRVVIENLAEL